MYSPLVLWPQLTSGLIADYDVMCSLLSESFTEGPDLPLVTPGQ